MISSLLSSKQWSIDNILSDASDQNEWTVLCCSWSRDLKCVTNRFLSIILLLSNSGQNGRFGKGGNASFHTLYLIKICLRTSTSPGPGSISFQRAFISHSVIKVVIVDSHSLRAIRNINLRGRLEKYDPSRDWLSTGSQSLESVNPVLPVTSQYIAALFLFIAS